MNGMIDMLTENSDDNIYSYDKVDLTLIGNGGARLDAPSEISVSYYIELEQRSWGIKNIDVSVAADVTIHCTDDTNEEVDIVVPAADIAVEWLTGSNIVPSELLVELDTSFHITKAVLTMFYIAP